MNMNKLLRWGPTRRPGSRATLAVVLCLGVVTAEQITAEPAPEPGRPDATKHIPAPVSRDKSGPPTLMDYSALTFTRASTATEIDGNGNVYTVAKNVLRWDPTGRYVLLEKNVSQLAQANEDISDAHWVKTNYTTVN